MSIREHAVIACPQCGQEQPFALWSSVNATLDPEQKERLLAGDLMRSTCDGCGHTFSVLYPLLYHDMDGMFMIQFAPEGEAEDLADPFINKMTGQYRLRVVHTRNALLEKIRALAVPLDDRTLEIFKIRMEQQIASEAEGELLFCGTSSDLDDGVDLHFTWLTAAGTEDYNVPLRSFAEFELELSEKMRLGPPTVGEWLTIDRRFAVTALQAAFGSRPS